MDTKKRALNFLRSNLKEDGLNDGALSFAVRDLLTDLMHICEDEGLSFPELMDSANEVFYEEFED